jgi:phosphohistidine phosphatase
LRRLSAPGNLKKTPPATTSPKRIQVKRREPVSIAQPARKSVGREPLNYIAQGLEKWWKDYLGSLDRFLQSASGRNVHDLRVAIRRLNTAFDLIDRFNPDNMVRRARGKLKDELSALSSLRDAHVEMVRMRGYLKEFPEMKLFYEQLADKEAQQLKAVKKVKWKQDRRFVEISYNRALLRLNARRGTSSGENTRRIIEASMDVLLDNLSKRLDKVTQSNFASIHKVRLAFRPLRYTLEMVQPLLGLDRKQLRNASFLARLMGRIQDLDVLMKDLVESDWRKERGLAATVEVWLDLERQRLEKAQRFFRAVPKFSTIWKPIIHEQPEPTPAQSQTLYILRHGIAVNRGDPQYPLDSDRPLTIKGMRRMRQIANGMRRMRVAFDAILSSPYKRALETAFVVAREYGVGKDVQTIQALKAEVLPEEVIRTLLDKFSTCAQLLLVGHDPQLSALISTLTSGSAGSRPLLKKGGLCRLQVDGLQVGKCATLEWLLSPRQLMSIA